MPESSILHPIRLAIDTSTESCSVAIQTLNGQIVDATHSQSTHHAQAILPLIENLLKNTKLELSDIQDIVVSIGPGSFTGVRAGIATAQGLAYGLNIPIIPIGTLDLVALGTHPVGTVHVVMDARIQQFYVASYDWVQGELIIKTPANLFSMSELLNYLSAVSKNNQNNQLVGTGLALIQDQLILSETNPKLNYPQAKNVLLYLNQHVIEAINPMDIKPLYVRNDVATVKQS